MNQKQIFQNWLNNYKPMLFKVLRAYTQTQADQEDLFQEITMQIWRSIPNFQGQSAESTWIYRVALNTALTWKRKEKKHQQTHESIDGVSHIL
ncbi:MAG: RNA polymerase sigma factor, partial [Bacteroidetes bacterium]|nr:RNA polymerase sigma factor [Bacteroidota bacterium]